MKELKEQAIEVANRMFAKISLELGKQGQLTDREFDKCMADLKRVNKITKLITELWSEQDTSTSKPEKNSEEEKSENTTSKK